MDLIYRTAQEMNTIFIVTMHQPSTAMFLDFQHVMMLTKGEIAYFGPGRALSDYCELSMKSPVPYGVNPSDHFLNLINPDFVGADKAIECIASWKSYRATQDGTNTPLAPATSTLAHVPAVKGTPGSVSSLAALANIPSPPKAASAVQTFSLLLRRQVKLVLRDPTQYTGRMIFYLLSNLFFAIVYVKVRDMDQTQIYPRFVLMVWFVSVPANLAIGTVYSQSVELELVAKEIRNGMYSPGMYLIVTSLCCRYRCLRYLLPQRFLSLDTQLPS